MSDLRRRRPQTARAAFRAAVVALGLLAMLRPATASEPLPMPRAAGEPVPSFYCRAVTGPLMNRSVCYVCRYGERPVVLVFARRLVPELSPLLQDIDRSVDRHRAHGLRSFGVLVSDDPRHDAADVQTFAFDHKLTMPLTIATESVAAPGCYNLPPDAAVTVVLYRRQRLVTRFALHDDELTPATLRHIAEAVERFACGDAAAGSDGS